MFSYPFSDKFSLYFLLDISHKVKEAARKALLKLKPAFSLWIVLVGMSKATLAPRDRTLVPIRPEKFTTGSYPPSRFPNNPMPPVIPM